MSLIVNFFGGPGAGKSKFAAHIFAWLKWENITCELIPEYAKRKTFEESFNVLNNQIYIFGKQYHSIKMVDGKVDVILVDSPIFLSLCYARLFKTNTPTFDKFILETFNEMNNLNIYLTRDGGYDPIGRNQTEEESKKIDDRIYSLLQEYRIPFINYDAVIENVEVIKNLIIKNK